MKTECSFIALMCILVVVAGVIAQSTMRDVVYLKNGGIIKGVIVEQVPGKTIKVQTQDGSLFVYSLNEVDKITKEGSSAIVMEKASPPARLDFSLLFGGAVYDGFFFGTGVRAGATFGPGVYGGLVVVNHFTDEVSVSYLGGELGYHIRADKVSIQPYVSLGTGLGGGEAAFYIAPAFALYVWATPELAIGPDIKYVFVPDAEDGFGGIYLGFAYRL